MSKSGKSGKKKQETTESQEKVLTRYDLKMQRRQEQKRKDARDKKIASAVGILLVVGLACLVASFPIRNYMTVYGTYIVVGGEKVSRVEYDYNFNLVLNTFRNSQEALTLAMFGLDLSGDLTQQMYSDTLTWQDYFEQMAVDNLLRTKALRREMEAAGFRYDADAEYNKYKENMRQAASEAGMTVNDYVQQLFGPYATLSRIEDFVKEGLAVGAYFDTVAESRQPSQEEIQAYYESDKDSYDSVDYRLITVNAELPTEPTELADPVEETEDGEETAYQPSEAEIEAAMALAKTEAETQLENIAVDGELYENLLRYDINTKLSEWLFDQARKPGDTTVIEDSAYNRYYALEFVERYLDQTPSADARIIMTEAGGGQAVLDQWLAGDATEESFADLADRYSTITTVEGGLFEGLSAGGVPQDLADWIFGQGRVNGEVVLIAPENDVADYVLYYIGTNDPQWKLSIRSILLDNSMNEYIDRIIEGMEVEDPHNYLYYLKVQAEEDQAESDAGLESDGAGDESDADGSSAE